MKYTMYVGGYGAHSIAHMTFDEGRIECLERYEAINASYLCTDLYGKHLYAVSETQSYMDKEGGSVLTYGINETGILMPTGVQPTYGKDPCHLICSENHLLVSCYNSGCITRYPLKADGTAHDPLSLIVHGRSGNTAHVHQILPVPDGRYAVADLGLDQVFFYRNITTEGSEFETVSVPSGFGPRHMVFLEESDIWYVLCELRGQLLVYRGYGKDAVLCARYSIGIKEGAAAALRLSPDRKMLLATGRDQHIICLYSISENGLLSHLADIDTLGNWPRDAQFSPDGRYLLCANERSNNITVFSLCDGHAEYIESTPAQSPTCILFV